MIALDEDDQGAITIGGSSILTASRGLAALSTDAEAISVNGNPEVDAGWTLAAGGIDDWLKNPTDDVIIENMEGLYDPNETLSPPDPAESQISRTCSCSAEPSFTTADIATRSVNEYDCFQGSNERDATGWAFTEGREDTDLTTTALGQSVPEGTVEETVVSSSVSWTNLGGNGGNRKWERRTETVYTTYSNVTVEGGAQAGSVRPGSYGDIRISCDTAFAPGVCNICGGGLKITVQYEVAASGVMFVLYDAAYIDIAGGADINLTAMQASDLMSLGVATKDANELAGMLVFEDRDSPGSGKTKMNGNANTILNGTLYFPVSEVFFAGTVGVTSRCLMIATNNITITGTTEMSTFCPTGSSEDEIVATTAAKVRLVA